MSTEADDGPSVSAAEPGGAEAGGLGGRGTSKKALGVAKYSERSTNSRSLEDSDSVVDEAQPALGATSLSLSLSLSLCEMSVTEASLS